jgi:hypothetical protein
MTLPAQRLTITLAEYRFLKPGLNVLAKALATAKEGHFPHRHPWHLIDNVASDVFRNQAFDDEMASRILRVRGKLWDMTQSRKVYVDAFELWPWHYPLGSADLKSQSTSPNHHPLKLSCSRPNLKPTGNVQNAQRQRGWEQRTTDRSQSGGEGLSIGRGTTVCTSLFRSAVRQSAPTSGRTNGANSRD